MVKSPLKNPLPPPSKVERNKVRGGGGGFRELCGKSDTSSVLLTITPFNCKTADFGESAARSSNERFLTKCQRPRRGFSAS